MPAWLILIIDVVGIYCWTGLAINHHKNPTLQESQLKKKDYVKYFACGCSALLIVFAVYNIGVLVK